MEVFTLTSKCLQNAWYEADLMQQSPVPRTILWLLLCSCNLWPLMYSFNFWPLISSVPSITGLACIPAKCLLIYYVLLHSVLSSLNKRLNWNEWKIAGHLTTPNTPPNFSCSVTDVSLIIPHGTGGTIVNWSNPDLPPMIMLLIQTRRPGDYFPVGSTEVIYTYLNEMTGERIKCAFNVNVKEDVSKG